MNYWWVCQNKSHKYEYNGNFMWSPKRKSNGYFHQYYENMKRASIGDIVYSYVNKQISKVGIVTKQAITSVNPHREVKAGESWNKIGWLVETIWFDTPQSLAPKDIIDELRPILPHEYSPLKVDGGGKEIYLTHIPLEMADVLNKYLKLDSIFIQNKIDSINFDSEENLEKIDEEIIKRTNQNTDIDTTEVESLRKARKGQGKYRKNLELLENKCRITKVSDKRILRASHIKPWRACEDNFERLDGNNGLLLTPTIDLLFDQGYISFEDNGNVLFSKRIEESTYELLNLNAKKQINVGKFNENQKKYLSFHRNEIFKG